MELKRMLKPALYGVLVTMALTAMPAMGKKVKAKPMTPEKIEELVARRLKSMTLEEKVGQMCQLTIESVTDYPASAREGRPVLNKAKLDTVFSIYKVGSILNVPLGVAQDRDTYRRLIGELQEASIAATGIPMIYGLDQIHGSTYILDGTLFPQNINLAASFRPWFAYRAGEVTGYETRAASVPWSFNPVVDLGRDPRWSRMWENFGEDCLVNSIFGVQAVKGEQGSLAPIIDKNHVAVFMKHYMGYGVPRTGKDRTPSNITPIEMREKHFAPFKAAIDAGALSVMVNSASNDGIPFHANPLYLTGWLKEGLDWDGVIVSDWADINNLYSRDHVAATPKEAVKMGINAGVDMSMVPYDTDFCKYLVELVREGEVPESRVDDAAARILRLKYRLGLFESPVQEPEDYPLFGSKEFADDALQAALESEILLKNDDNILPLKEGTRILLTGPNADSMRPLNGGWSYTWQGHRAADLSKGNTIYKAMSERFGKENVILEKGVCYEPHNGDNWMKDLDCGIDKAVKAAADVDVIVACIGENSYCETPGNDDDLSLSPRQISLVQQLAATGKPVVLILNEGRPRIINSIEPLAKAVVDILLPGNYGADALAMLLAGDANFSAKLPFTYPKYQNALYTYDYKPQENLQQQMAGAYNYDAKMNVQWPFGHGLSYTDFKYSNLNIDKKEFGPQDMLTITVDVTNTGDRAGMEPVLLYSKDVAATIMPDNIRLRAFDKVDLQPGETKTVTFTLPASDLSFVSIDDKWHIEKGDFKFKAGDLWIDAVCTADAVFENPPIPGKK